MGGEEAPCGVSDAEKTYYWWPTLHFQEGVWGGAPTKRKIPAGCLSSKKTDQTERWRREIRLDVAL